MPELARAVTATAQAGLHDFILEQLRERNRVSAAFFPRESTRLAAACRSMSDRFLKGGRLLAFGRGAYATDAQHVSVEFVHPVIVGKRALPALDLSIAFREWLPAILTPDDIVMGFGPPEPDPEVASVLAHARERGALTFALPGIEGDYAVSAPSHDPYIHQEAIEILYHTLWESVHVFFEHRELGHDVGAASFLYPYLGTQRQDLDRVAGDVASSIVMKAQDDERLREQVGATQAGGIAQTIVAMRERIALGGKLILFGNGGSATDANDWAIDCVMPPDGARPIPAVSLSLEPANITAIANDVGTDVIFVRQLIAQANPNDVVVGISTSGGSKNVLATFAEARKRGLLSVALLGYDGGDVVRSQLADIAIVVHCDYIPRIQEVQASIYHIIRQALGGVPQ
ncbi:MAG: SIS domain-containing protein, partial [Candidatus Eremiobacteraeota bacterium]|nr:SIS domain-containing protein [Candidatus Eremiobacteraeota bacterium]MBC5808776.1 SIS domain-containing protein [Candidatus Eremiobacteraeota bacterium]